MASATETDIGGLYNMNAQKALSIRTTLEEIDHPQPPMRIDNSTVDGIMNTMVKQKKRKAMDKIFYYLQDRVEQG